MGYVDVKKKLERELKEKEVSLELEIRRRQDEIDEIKLILGTVDKQIPRVSGCYICDDTSNYRFYKNQQYQHCPYCGQNINYEQDRV